VTVLRWLLALAGLGVVGVLVLQIGPPVLWSAFRSLSWGLPLVLLFPSCLVVALDTLGWRLTFPSAVPSSSRLLGVRLAGDALNLATPTASIGGDPVKAYLLRPGVPFRDGLVSVVADKTTTVVAQTLTLLAALLVAGWLLPVSGALLLTMLGALVIEILCVCGFVAVQLSGLAGRGGRLLARVGFAPSPERQAMLDGMDRALRSLYFRRGVRLLASVLCHFLALALATFEVFIVLRYLDAPISLTTAFVIGALGTAVKFVSFMVPASLGALEGGNVAIFAALGLGGAAGLSYSLVRRLREIVWIGAGFLALSLLSSRPTLTAGGRVRDDDTRTPV